MTFDPRTHYQDPDVALHYDGQRFTSPSGRLFRWAERLALKRTLRMLEPGALILDSPTGTGRLLPLFLAHGARVVAADISAEMLGMARRRVGPSDGRVTFSRMDFTHIPFGDDAVAATFSIRFLPHIPPEERVRMLREFSRISKRWVIVSVSLSSPWHRLRRRLKAWLGHPKPTRHPVTNAAIAEELRQAGLREVRRMWTVPVLSEQVLLVCERA